MSKILFFSLLLFLSSCAHRFMRGTVAKKISSKKAIICLGKNEVKIGDVIKFEKSECTWAPSNNIRMHQLSSLGGSLDHTGYGKSECMLIYLGRGVVIELINNHYSIVKVNSNFQFNETTQVEIIDE